MFRLFVAAEQEIRYELVNIFSAMCQKTGGIGNPIILENIVHQIEPFDQQAQNRLTKEYTVFIYASQQIVSQIKKVFYKMVDGRKIKKNTRIGNTICNRNIHSRELQQLPPEILEDFLYAGQKWQTKEASLRSIIRFTVGKETINGFCIDSDLVVTKKTVQSENVPAGFYEYTFLDRTQVGKFTKIGLFQELVVFRAQLSKELVSFPMNEISFKAAGSVCCLNLGKIVEVTIGKFKGRQNGKLIINGRTTIGSVVMEACAVGVVAEIVDGQALAIPIIAFVKIARWLQRYGTLDFGITYEATAKGFLIKKIEQINFFSDHFMVEDFICKANGERLFSWEDIFLWAAIRDGLVELQILSDGKAHNILIDLKKLH